MSRAQENSAGRDPLPAAAVGLETQHAVAQFLYRQAEILDDRLWDDWLALFTPDGHYWMPAAPEQLVGEGQPNIFYEDHYLMRVRIGRVNHPNAWSQYPPNRTGHVVSNVVVEAADPASGDLVVRSKFLVAEYRNDEQRVFAGKYRHQLKKGPDGYLIQLQRVDIVNVEGPFDYVLQYWI
ncbi:MAG: aromatic-ring-hydroxylating dioxygenase subunit beta [Proteobacteria bacterium]|nr:aromatic-ring-hydroxylating dioxygenase subunit beta [Pseudomonadota bacterium]